jgi:hypothetical protein
MKFKLLNDIRSNNKTKPPYALAGDTVTLVSERGEVLIVENKKGERFSAKRTVLEKI